MPSFGFRAMEIVDFRDPQGKIIALGGAIGFRDRASQDTDYARCDVWMERPLSLP